jgi:chemosensory pili system protein ChpA (sensor histidine kinase/response regulator)
MGDMSMPQVEAPDAAPLAWLAGEIRASTEAAIAAIGRFLADRDAGALREAREQVHTAAGAVRMLELRGAALMLDATEQLLKRWESLPDECDADGKQKVEAALRAAFAYLEGLRSGRPDQPIRLYPHYREVRLLVGAARAHPADLLFPDLTRRPALASIGVLPMTADQLRVRRARFEGALLRFLRDPGDQDARRDMHDALFDLERLPQRGLARSFWWVVRGLLDALEADAIAVDVDLKRVLARLNLQLRRLIDGGSGVAERLLVDALYYVGRADPHVARVAEVRQLYDLEALLPADYEKSRLVLLDVDRVRALRRTLAEAKSAWTEAAGSGDAAAFVAHVDAAREAAEAVDAGPLGALLSEIGRLAADIGEADAASRESLSIEVATAMLLVDLAVEELPNIDERFEARAGSMIERLHAARRGEAPAAIEPWLSELARKAQDRQTMLTVVTELNGLLREIEQRLDRFFRSPAERAELGGLDAIIEQMASVLGLLGLDDAVAALDDARDSVRRYADPAHGAAEADFARLAGNLGAVGFLVGTLQQEGDPRSRFRWDAATTVFSADLAVTTGAPVGGDDDAVDAYGHPVFTDGADAREENVESAARQHLQRSRELGAQLAADPADAQAARALLEVAQQLANDADLLDDAAMKSLAREVAATARDLTERPDAATAARLSQALGPAAVEPPAPAVAPAPLPPTQVAADAELLEIFVEEADEVLAGIDDGLDALRAAAADKAVMTTVRRAFHTLKGSSRMVGLTDFGEGAWAVEQCFNAWLSQERAATDDLIALAAAARRIMAGWLRAIRADAAARIDAQPLAEAAHRVREGQPFAIDAAALPADAETAASAEADFDILAALEAEIGAGQEAPITAAVPGPAVDEILPAFDEAAAGEAAAPDAHPHEVGAASAAAPGSDGGDLRQVGPVELSPGLYSVFLGEADDIVHALVQDLAEWRRQPDRPASPAALRSAHSLAGITATVGLRTVWTLADPLDDLLKATLAAEPSAGIRLEPAQFDVIDQVVERIRGMLHQFAAGFYPPAAPAEEAALRELIEAVQSLREEALTRAAAESAAEPEPEASVPPPAPETDAPPSLDFDLTEDIGSPAAVEAREEAPATTATGETPAPEEVAVAITDDIDADLLPVFLAEAGDLLPTAGSRLRAVAANRTDREPLRDLMRLLHTVKGSARMAGAMRLGERVHDIETRTEAAMALPELTPDLVDDLIARYDAVMVLYDDLQHGRPASVPGLAAAPVPTPQESAEAAPAEAIAAATAETAAAAVAPADTATAAQSFIRVRADVLDRLVDQAGEVLIARSRVENDTAMVKASLADLHDNIQRLRSQMRELEIQAEAQIQARSEKLAEASATFDPLEFDRFTRLQELTRMIAESVEDVATVQQAMNKGLQTSVADLSAQYRLTRELQQQLMRVRLVPFASIGERIFRVARQAAKEVGKRVNVDLGGGGTELDRVVLERMAGPIEHMVRNAIVHGLETPQQRRAAGKAETGELQLEVRQEGNEIVIVVADDGAGLDLDRIRAQALDSGLLRADQHPSDRELMDLIFAPGFSTAAEVTELAGRGVGLDVVRSELAAFGGRVAIATDRGHGTRFTLNLPMSLAVTQVVLATVGGRRYAIPAGMVEHVRRVRPEDAAEAIAAGVIDMPDAGETTLRTLAQLLGEDMTLREGRQVPVVLLRSGDDRMAVAVDEVSSNQEVVVKNVGPQVARLAGILGATILGNGEIVLIINPVQLIVRAPEPPRLRLATGAEPERDSSRAPASGQAQRGVTLAASPLVMVVDDSLTVRRVTQRLLERSGYDVLLAKDGVDALRQLRDVRPDVMLVDIEMPRMDGFDLTRHVRGTELTRSIPIVMITSRTADKHRKMAMEMGVNAYLGKPYQDDELLALLAGYVKDRVVA